MVKHYRGQQGASEEPQPQEEVSGKQVDKPSPEKILEFWASDIAQCFVPLCTRCKRRATEQTYKGQQAQENLHRPVNWGYYCKRCADAGRQEEAEAMYG